MVGKLTPIEQIKGCINSKTNFLLSGGAGCGKTDTLKRTLEYIFSDPILKRNNVACITFTNAAANEIKSRIENPNLHVSTIHEFLWSCIKQHQAELKLSLLTLIEEEKKKTRSGIKYDGDEELSYEYFENKSIEYREYRKLEDGIVSHNEVLKLANYMFAGYPLLCRIVKNKFPFIFIDEYQDTDKKVIGIFLDSLQANNNLPNKITVGLFGDSMQSIYAYGIGDINNYVQMGIVKEITKEDNYRSSTSVIDLINKLRFDTIKQKASGDNKETVGSAKFLYSTTDIDDLDQVKKHEIFGSWDFGDSSNTKELYLTHRLIAGKAGYSQIFTEYGNADRLFGDNKDRLMKHLFHIWELIDLYESGKYNVFIKKCNYKISKISDKKMLSDNMVSLANDQDKKTIGDLIELADRVKIFPKDDGLKSFISENSERYEAVCKIPDSESNVLYMYEQEYMPYSTQHNVKGTEFDNVLVVLDNGGWNQYNFGDLFGERLDKQNIIVRTRKIFYVCCSRAKHNLAVFFPNPSNTVLSTAKDWFGESNLLKIM